MRVLSQVYQSEEDHVEVRGLDPRVGKSCILESHLWTRIVRERGSLKTHISFLDHSNLSAMMNVSLWLAYVSYLYTDIILSDQNLLIKDAR